MTEQQEQYDSDRAGYYNTRQQILDDWMLRLTEYTIFMFWGPQNTKMTLKFIC